jgi:anti-anti-sigma factor
MGIPHDDHPADRVQVALHSDTTAIVSLIGEHDLSLGDALRAALETAAEQRSCVLVDLSRCTLLDSTGIAVLLDAQKRVRAARGRFALVIPAGQGAVARVAEIIRLGDLVPIAQSREDALTSLAQPPGS